VSQINRFLYLELAICNYSANMAYNLLIINVGMLPGASVVAYYCGLMGFGCTRVHPYIGRIQ